MAKLRNPPPKRVKLTKKLGYEALKLLRYIDFRMTMTRDMLDFQDWKRQVSGDMCAVLANMNRWWDGEKQKRKDKKDAEDSKTADSDGDADGVA